MKTITIIFCSLFLFAAAGYGQAPSKLKKNEAEVTFIVNMSCHHCKKKIENAIPHEKGVLDMKVTLDTKEVWIKFNTTKTDREKLVKAFEKLGYTAKEAEAH
ncbi:MAG: heavy-metal-associated domain-containing protein [Prevotellaceae bacterium]|jgi:copper chaperone CopZ|nr:heavy-metal-associated domain-containing protein [Prevotellaceae bacterium]